MTLSDYEVYKHPEYLRVRAMADGYLAELTELRKKVNNLIEVADSKEKSMDYWWAASNDEWAVPEHLPSLSLQVVLENNEMSILGE